MNDFCTVLSRGGLTGVGVYCGLVYVLVAVLCLLYYQGWFDCCAIVQCEWSGLWTVTMLCLLYYQGWFDCSWRVLRVVWSMNCNNALFTVLSRLVCWVYCDWFGICTLYNALFTVLSRVVWLLLTCTARSLICVLFTVLCLLYYQMSMYCLQCIVYCIIKVGLTILTCTARSLVCVLFTVLCLLFCQGWFDYCWLVLPEVWSVYCLQCFVYCTSKGILCTVYNALFTVLSREGWLLMICTARSLVCVLFTVLCLMYCQGWFDCRWRVLRVVWSLFCDGCCPQEDQAGGGGWQPQLRNGKGINHKYIISKV